MLFDGRGVVMDLAEALQWYERAAQQGHARAMNLLARCHEEGWGCGKDPEQAFQWYRRSAESDYFRGQYNYASALAERGFIAEASEWFARAAVTSSSDEQHQRRGPV
jgi:TPR repeat protein